MEQDNVVEINPEVYDELKRSEVIVDLTVALTQRMWSGLRKEGIPDEICVTLLLDWFRSNFTDIYTNK